jgi:hypothetical protein
MKSTQRCRTINLVICVVLVLLLSNQALACFSPSPVEMGKGQAMACCVEHCRMETTPQAAKQVCEQSHIALTQPLVLARSVAPVVNFYVQDLPDSGLFLPTEPFSQEETQGTYSASEYTLSKFHQSIKLFILNHSLLI